MESWFGKADNWRHFNQDGGKLTNSVSLKTPQTKKNTMFLLCKRIITLKKKSLNCGICRSSVNQVVTEFQI